MAASERLISSDPQTSERRILRAARAVLGRGRRTCCYEHGQWWVTDQRGQWSVEDASGGPSREGLDFERVTDDDEDEEVR